MWQGPTALKSFKGLAEPSCRNFKALFFPPLSPNPSPPPPGGSGELNNHIRPTFCAGWRSRADANIQTHREPPECGTPVTGDAACVQFEGWPGTVNAPSLKTRPHTAVEGQFECWRFTVNSITSNTRPHRAVELPFLARRGERGVGGESGGCSARIATSLIAACAGTARATVRKHPQSETHGVALKPPAWRLCKCHSHTARYQVVTGRVVRGQGVSRGRDNSASHSGTALAKSKWSMADCNGFKGSPGAPSYPCCTSSMA